MAKLLEARIQRDRVHVDLSDGLQITYRRNGRVSVRKGTVCQGQFTDYIDMVNSVKCPIRPYVELIGQWFGLAEQEWAGY
jgi:hypothetical protein